MSDLVERLLGVYRVRDSATLSVEATPDNENYFVRTFPTTPIQVEAAREIERLRKENEALRGKVGRLERLNEYHQKRAEFAGRHVLALREALKPFVDLADEHGGGYADYDSAFVAVKHLRRARSAYEGEVK